eukprot:4901536-Prymnesium_polylepis.1
MRGGPKISDSGRRAVVAGRCRAPETTEWPKKTDLSEQEIACRSPYPREHNGYVSVRPSTLVVPAARGAVLAAADLAANAAPLPQLQHPATPCGAPASACSCKISYAALARACCSILRIVSLTRTASSVTPRNLRPCSRNAQCGCPFDRLPPLLWR